jgi:hypothetical protein
VFNLSLLFLVRLLSVGSNDTVGLNILNQSNDEAKIRFTSNIVIAQFLISIIVSTILKIIFPEITSILFLIFMSIELNWIYIGLLREKEILTLNIIVKILSIFLLIIFKELGILSIYTLIALSFAQLIYLLIGTKKLKVSLNHLDWNQIKNYYNHSKHPFFSKIISSGNDSVIPILIGQYLGLDRLYMYDITRKVIESSKIPNSILNTFLVSRTNQTGLNFTLKIIFIRLVLSGTFITILYLLIDIWTNYFKLSPHEIHKLFVWMAMTAIATSISYYLTGYLLIKTNRLEDIGRSQYISTLGFATYLIVGDFTLTNIIQGIFFMEIFKILYITVSKKRTSLE